MNIYPWQQELLDNPPRASQLYSPEEWEDIVLNELFEPNTMKGEAHPLYGKKLSDETKKRMSEARKGKPKSEEHKKKISGEGNPFYGKKHSEETRKRIAELSAERAKGERNPMYGKKHSEETKRKMSESQKGRKFSEETKEKMRNAAKRRASDPEWRKKMSESSKKSWAEGTIGQNMPPRHGEANPFYGKKHTEETKARLSEIAKEREPRAHTEESKVAISKGNMRAIKDRVREYKYMVKSPRGGDVRCRTESERDLAVHLCAHAGVASVVGEDKMEFVEYEIDGQRRRTVADFMVKMRGGLTVIVEGKSPGALYRAKERARLVAMWEYCKENGYKMVLAINKRRLPDMVLGPFVTDAFVEKAKEGTVDSSLLVDQRAPLEKVPSPLKGRPSPLKGRKLGPHKKANSSSQESAPKEHMSKKSLSVFASRK